ncbi:MAG: leucyl aminopeptidase family protein [Pseudomonadota bacterium]|nr:leucyl aminopeptidase family protein [Pseudomonadota bacterium]
MSLKLQCHDHLPAGGDWPASHVLLVLPPPVGKALPAGLPAALRPLLEQVLARRGVGVAELAGEGCVFQDGAGRLISVAVVAPSASAFEQGTALRKALAPLLAEHPASLALGFGRIAADLAGRAVFAALVNAAVLPTRKGGKGARALRQLHLHGVDTSLRERLGRVEALAEANTLARTLTLLPPNDLDPGAYRERVRKLARTQGFGLRELDVPRLKRLGAGAFLAVAQGSANADAAILHLHWKPRGARRRLALVGKGICFDTGGHNLKTARHMYGMHEDMNGSAVALAALQAIAALRLPVEVDCFLAVAQNHLSAGAYKQNDVVTALDGTTIEIVHTDAEGRMVLADTLTLAAREKPALIVDFATLTGSMVTALGRLQSGVFASRPELEVLARAASAASGERVVCFAAEADYDALLDSKVADIKQCLQEGEADHILAARFLNRFRGEADWIHVDLSSYSNSNGLGAVASEVNGFGVAWTVALVEQWLAGEAVVTRKRST